MTAADGLSLKNTVQLVLLVFFETLLRPEEQTNKQCSERFLIKQTAMLVAAQWVCAQV